MEKRGALGLAGAPLSTSGNRFYVNPIMQEKLRFESAQAVEVFVEVVEALQIHGLDKFGMQDAGTDRRFAAVLCAGLDET